MRRLVTGKQMKEIDGYAIRKVGIPSLVLMERAALCACEEVCRLAGREKPEEKRVLIARRWLGFSFCAARFRRCSRSVTRHTGRGR